MAIQPPQRFELDDLTHVEREARTIYAPGATPGDVLAVQSDHSLVAAPGGGSEPVQSIYISDGLTVVSPGNAPLAVDTLVDGPALLDITNPLAPLIVATGLYDVSLVVTVLSLGAGGDASALLSTSAPGSAAVAGATPSQLQHVANLSYTGFWSAGDAFTVSGDLNDSADRSFGVALTLVKLA